MSSVVNKSGTRFVPKAIQRRSAASVPPPPPKALDITSTEGLNDDKTEVSPHETNDNDEDEDEDDADYINGSTAVASIPMASQPMFDKNFAPTQTSTQVHAPLSSSRSIPRSSRLDSLSKGSSRPVFRAGYNEPIVTGGITGGPMKRLSGISTTGLKKVVVTDTDTSLNAIKKRRLSTRTSTSRRSGSTHRVSIISKIAIPTATAISDPITKVEDSNDLYHRTDSLYERYTVKNIKEIPKNIEDGDSSKYLIDEQNFTMADLCRPNLPIGEVSENFERAKEATKAKLKKRKERRDLRKRARDEFKSVNSLNKEEIEEELRLRKEHQEKLINAEVPEERRQIAGPQVKMGVDGKLILDEESTVLDRHKQAELDNAHKEKVNENPFENLYNYGTYGKGSYTDPWKTEELIKFYKALSMWGTDFNLIAQLFPYRTRRQVKAKFISEEKKHAVMIELALRSRLPPDFDRYCEDIQKNIGSVDSFNKKIEKMQQDHEIHLKELEEAKQKAKLEDSLGVPNNNENDNKKSSGGFKNKDLKHYRKTEIVLGTIDSVKRKRDDDEPENGKED